MIVPKSWGCLAADWLMDVPLPLLLISLFKDQSGVTAIEYSLIAALIAVAAIASMTTIGTTISTTFSMVAGKL